MRVGRGARVGKVKGLIPRSPHPNTPVNTVLLLCRILYNIFPPHIPSTAFLRSGIHPIFLGLSEGQETHPPPHPIPPAAAKLQRPLNRPHPAESHLPHRRYRRHRSPSRATVISVMYIDELGVFVARVRGRSKSVDSENCYPVRSTFMLCITSWHRERLALRNPLDRSHP